MAAASRPASTRSTFARKVVDRGAGEILLTSMDRDGTKAGYDIALTRAVADAVRAPVIARAASARSIIWSKACATAMRPRCLPPRSSISAPIRSPRPRRIWPAPDCRCGWTCDCTRLDHKRRRMSDFHPCRSGKDRRRARPLRRFRLRGRRSCLPRGIDKAAQETRRRSGRDGDRGRRRRHRGRSFRKAPISSIIGWSCWRSPAFRSPR